MKKKYKRALVAALAAVMIWNTCDWHHRLAVSSSAQYIEEVKELSDASASGGSVWNEMDLELPDKLRAWVLQRSIG